MFYAISTASNNASAFCFLVAAVRRGIPKWKTEKGRKKERIYLIPFHHCSLTMHTLLLGFAGVLFSFHEPYLYFALTF